MNRISKYILTADDYGACDFIDQGIRLAIQAGKINSVACFAVPFGIEDDLDERMQKLLKLRENYDFAIGLHFSLTAGRSNDLNVFSQGNTLTEYDKYEDKHYLMNAYNYRFNRINRQELADELNSQITRLTRYIPKNEIDSISNHHGIVYMNTRLFEPYAETAAFHNIPIRSPLTWRRAGLRTYNWDHLPVTPAIRQGVKLRLLDQLRNALDTDSRLTFAEQKQLVYTTCLVDEIYGQAYTENLSALFKSYEESIFSAEFMFHLGDSSGASRNQPTPWGIDDGYFGWRERELQVLLNFEPPNTLLKTTFRQLVPGDEEMPDEAY